MRMALFGLALLTTACGDQRSFDERFDRTENEISARANAIEANLAEPVRK